MIPDRYKDFYGDQIRWFIGRVVDINDPLQMARMRVRIYGVHSENTLDIPNEDLPWAEVVAPVTEGGTEGLGNPLGIKVGSLVFGIFMDGQSSQLPLVIGSVPKYEDLENEGDRLDKSVNALARGTQTKPYTPDETILEPTDPYAAVYPYNRVFETESGHVKEYDDTPDAERIRELHKSGTFYQIGPDGDLVTHIVRDRYTVVVANDSLHVSGDVDIHVDGTTNIFCDQVNMSGNLRVDGDVSVGGDVVTDAGISHNSHTHTDPAGIAGSQTSTPN